MRRKDFLVMGVVLCCALGIFLVNRALSAPGAWVVVSVEGQEVERYSLSESLELVVRGAYGGQNRLLIQGGAASVLEADCPDGLCVRQKAVSRRGESIICIPHRLVVTVESGEEGELDGVAF